MKLKTRYYETADVSDVRNIVNFACDDAESLCHGALEATRARQARLEEIVNRLVQKLPVAEQLIVCGLQHSYRVVS